MRSASSVFDLIDDWGEVVSGIAGASLTVVAIVDGDDGETASISEVVVGGIAVDATTSPVTTVVFIVAAGGTAVVGGGDGGVS